MVITYPDEVTDTLEKVQQLMVPSNTGGFVPIAEVADLGYTRAQQSITRIDQSRVVTVTASIYGRDLGSISRDIQAKLDQVPLPSGYTIEFGGTSQEMMDSFADLGLALIMAILLVYMIMAAQFEGLLYPFVIMFSLPPTVIGVIIGLAVTGQTLNILSMIGMIMLAGIVVNNAIVLVDYINVLRRDHGMEKFEAIGYRRPHQTAPDPHDHADHGLRYAPAASEQRRRLRTHGPIGCDHRLWSVLLHLDHLDLGAGHVLHPGFSGCQSETLALPQ